MVSRAGYIRWGAFTLAVMVMLTGAGLWAGYHFYYVFEESPQWFRWRYQWVSQPEVYTDRWGYLPGDTVVVYASAGRGTSQLLLYDIMLRDTVYQGQVMTTRQPLAQHPSVHGTGWVPACYLPLRSSLSPGWYVLEIIQGTQAARTTVLIQPREVSRRVALILSVNTWNAYNPWGGQSLYSRRYTPVVSFRRPQPLSDPFIPNTWSNHQLYYQAANKDRYLATWLDTTGVGYDVYTDIDLETGNPALRQYDVLILSTHSEYWSWRMLTHLNACLDSGASLLVLAGNVCAYISRYDTALATLTVHKRQDQLWENADSAGIRPFGLQYDYLGFHTYAPYQITTDSTWMLTGTGLHRDSLLGRWSDTYDYTYMYDTWWRNLLGLRNRGKMGAASGLEIDRRYAGTPEDWISVATGLNPRTEGHGEVYPDPAQVWSPGTGADMGYYIHRGGGMVFNVGSMAFTGALPYDPALRQLLHNVMQRCLAQAPTIRRATAQSGQ
ncbi:MAG: DUF6605 domain-containing protein [Bacteroidia bacterium]|nr:DUF6605 domain-containing protein [Bacteroidia bacterium]